MGGTIRTVLNVANYLVDHGYEVEIVSVLRYRKDPFFFIDPRIRIVVLHNKIAEKQRPKGMKNWSISKLLKVRSVLIHSEDEGYYHFSLVTDIKMYQYIKDRVEPYPKIDKKQSESESEIIEEIKQGEL